MITVFDKLSVVIPIGPNDSAWHPLLKDLTVLGPNIEIILAACQPPPENFNFPDQVTWLDAPQGRAKQLNAGAAQVSRPVVWFLHADTRVTAGVPEALASYIESNEVNLGYFKLKFANDGPGQTQLNAWAANMRSRYFGLPFGDQGFILHKSLLESLKGFDETVIVGEDLDFVVRVKAKGIPLQALPAALISSARRYQQQGWLTTTLRHVWLTWRLTQQAKRRLVVSL
ncbi:MAG: glycosyltransferase family 2 protein [Methyloprofundus sp.]|nr:glycosyltransferase family 2 protein [Methyloprofundus sp.]MDT8426134.1 glycosyltransferase family 2 protein [Methyloprofundus sp.]